MAKNPEGYSPNVTFVADDSKLEPTVAKVLTATVVVRDGKGGQACFDISEVNDLVKQLVSLMQTDAGSVKVIDLTKKTDV
jgi:predicted RNase H-related nuclease YkuK (DUF458 family)